MMDKVQALIKKPWLMMALLLLCLAGTGFALPTNSIALLVLSIYTAYYGVRQGAYVLLACLAFWLVMLQSGWAFPLVLDKSLLALAVWGGSALYTRTQGMSAVVEALAVLGCVVVLVLHLCVDNMAAWWIAQFDLMLKTVEAAGGPDVLLPAEKEQAVVVYKSMAHFATGLQIISNSFFVLLCVGFGQALAQRAQGLASKVREAFRQLRVSWTLVILLTINLLGILLKQPVAHDAFLVLLLPFVFAGLSLTHWVVAQRQKYKKTSLFFFYLGDMLLMPFSILVIGLMALIDRWYDLRLKLSNRLKLNS